MKVSGFSFIRDGVRFGYPFVESLRSALPICDEFVIAVGRSDDGTLERLKSLDEPKLKIIETEWNENIRKHGFVYGQQKMIAQFNCTGDWAFYLEGDELLHDRDLETIHASMQRYLDDTEVEVLVFDYHHFYGTPQWVFTTAHWYRKAARIIRNNIRSIAPDGLYWAVMREKNPFGRRNKRRTRYPKAAPIGAHIYHYGMCRAEHYLAAKAEMVNQYWEKGGWESAYGDVDPESLAPWEGEHPAIIQDWLANHANHALELNPDHVPTRRERKHRLTRKLEQRFGWDFSKRHFKLIR